jgi:hypothetical protein
VRVRASVEESTLKLTEYENARPNELIAELEAKLAAAQATTNAAALKDAVTSAFIKAGGRAPPSITSSRKRTTNSRSRMGLSLARCSTRTDPARR